MKKIPMILMLLVPYIVCVVLCADNTTSFNSAFGASLVLFVAVSLINMVYAFALPRLGYQGRQLLFWNMVLKLCNIPVFIAVFFIFMLFHILILPLIPAFILFDYLLLLSSTMYGVSGLVYCFNEGKLTRKSLIINVMAQFIFCFDVFSAIYCYVKLRDKEDTNILNKNDIIQGLEPLVTADPEAIEIFVNSNKDKFAELYYKNGSYTYTIEEKHCDDFQGEFHYYWCPGTYTASFFDTKEKAIDKILSIIEPR